MYDVFSLKLVILSMWLSRTLLKKGRKINKVEVNIKTYHVIYIVLRDFNPKGYNITL